MNWRRGWRTGEPSGRDNAKPEAKIEDRTCTEKRKDEPRKKETQKTSHVNNKPRRGKKATNGGDARTF